MLSGCEPWPDDLAARYRRKGYWRGERLGDILDRWTAEAPDRVAVVTAGTSRTYRDLDRRAGRLAAGLRGLGIGPRDRVVVALANGPSFVELSIALFRIGAIPVYALPAHRRAELEYLCRVTDAIALVAAESNRGFDCRPMAAEVGAAVDTVRHVLVDGDPGRLLALASIDAEPVDHEPPGPQEVAFFLLSGGTTGMPKLIPRTHDDYAYQLRSSAEAMGAGGGTVYLAALPIGHNAALGCPGVLGTLRLGGRVVIAASAAPTDAFDLIAAERPTLTTLMPPFLQLWGEVADAYDLDLSGLTVEVGGARLDPEVAREAQRRLGCTLTHWFGMAEGLLCCTRPGDPIDVAVATQGTPICADDELLVVDAGGDPVPPGEVGELLVRGPTTLRGYYRAAEYNRANFTADGFLHTGDLVRMTEQGRLQVTGRIKDVINRGGEKVAPGEVEDHLRTHPSVLDAAVVAVPDPRLGERTCAFVIAGEPAPALSDLREHLVRRGLAEYKLPDRLEIVETFPLTNIGKVDKARLRALAQERRPGPALSRRA